MQPAAARSAAIENTDDRAPVKGEVVSITLGVQRRASARHRGTLRELFLSIVAANELSARAQPLPAQPSTDMTLLLTEADCAPPEAVLPILVRIAAFALIASCSGAAAYLAQSLIP
jgi:hypothetical protein